jgi:hypothetical protein
MLVQDVKVLVLDKLREFAGAGWRLAIAGDEHAEENFERRERRDAQRVPEVGSRKSICEYRSNGPFGTGVPLSRRRYGANVPDFTTAFVRSAVGS